MTELSVSECQEDRRYRTIHPSMFEKRLKSFVAYPTYSRRELLTGIAVGPPNVMGAMDNSICCPRCGYQVPIHASNAGQI